MDFFTYGRPVRRVDRERGGGEAVAAGQPLCRDAADELLEPSCQMSVTTQRGEAGGQFGGEFVGGAVAGTRGVGCGGLNAAGP